MRAFALALLLVGAGGCSLLTDKYSECSKNADCPGGRYCVQSYCVTVKCDAVYGQADAGNVIAIGAPLPLTNADGTPDQAQAVDFEAVQLALNEINNNAGVGGRPFAVYACDTEGDSTLLTNEINYLVAQKGVSALLVSHSGQVLAAAPVAVAQGVLVMSPTATSTQITTLNANYPLPSGGSVRMVWRTAPSDLIQGEVIAQQILAGPYNGTKVQRLGILYVNNPYGIGLEATVSQTLSQAGASAPTVLPVRYGPGDSATITSDLNQLNAFAPDLTLAIGFPSDLVPIIRQAAQLPNLQAVPNGNPRWFFTDAAEDPALVSDATVQAQIQGAKGTAPAQGQTTDPTYLAFQQSFQAAYGVDPANTSFTSHSYDAMYLLALGAAHAVGPGPGYSGQVTGSTIALGLTQVSNPSFTPILPLGPSQFTDAVSRLENGVAINVNGTSGRLDFNPATGEAPSDIEIWQVAGSSFRVAGVVPPP